MPGTETSAASFDVVIAVINAPSEEAGKPRGSVASAMLLGMLLAKLSLKMALFTARPTVDPSPRNAKTTADATDIMCAGVLS